jgi:hypothetical protein
VIKRVGLLVGCTLAAWFVTAVPAHLLEIDAALTYSAVAVALCLVPTALTLLWADWAYRQSPELQLTMVLGGTGIRMGLVLGVALLLYTMLPYFQQQSFWIWLLVFYLLTLALEMVLVVKGKTAAERSQEPVSAVSDS